MVSSEQGWLVLHWRVDSFSTSVWYEPADGEMNIYRGAACDCDAWERHQSQPPEERTCPHIRYILAYISTYQDLGHQEDQLIERDVELANIERLPAPQVQRAWGKERRV